MDGTSIADDVTEEDAETSSYHNAVFEIILIHPPRTGEVSLRINDYKDLEKPLDTAVD